MNTCPLITDEIFFSYREKRLEDSENQKVHTHLESCMTCRQKYKEYLSTIQEIKDVFQYTFPQNSSREKEIFSFLKTQLSFSCDSITEENLLEFYTQKPSSFFQERMQIHLQDCSSCQKKEEQFLEIFQKIKAHLSPCNFTKTSNLQDNIWKQVFPKRKSYLKMVASILGILSLVLFSYFIATISQPVSLKNQTSISRLTKTHLGKKKRSKADKKKPSKRSFFLSISNKITQPKHPSKTNLSKKKNKIAFPKSIVVVRLKPKNKSTKKNILLIDKLLSSLWTSPVNSIKIVKTPKNKIFLKKTVTIPKGKTILGDFNHDGKVDVVDLMLMTKTLAKMSEKTKNFEVALVDVNGDQKMNIVDLMILSRRVLKN